MTDIVLIRHGQSLGNLIDSEIQAGDFRHCTPKLIANGDPLWPLSDLGITQSQTAGEFLRQRFPSGFSRVFCSPYLRAQETLAHMGYQDSILEPLLQEQDWGLLVGKYIVDNFEAHKQFDKEYPYNTDLRPLNGETVSEVNERVHRFWQRELSRSQNASILIVTHWVPMFLTRMMFNNMDLNDFYATYHVGQMIGNCQIDRYTDRNPLSGVCETLPAWMQTTVLGVDQSHESHWRKL